MTTKPNAIEARNLTKSYGEKSVLGGVDISVPEGTIFSLLGPNGAGKTTTVNILTTLIPASGGEAFINGNNVVGDADAVRKSIGVTGQFAAVDGLLTGRENLHLMGRLHHLGKAETKRRTEDLLERFDLLDAAKRAPATYSGGMKRRLDIAMCLMGDPKVIFLDEPTTGLDPAGRRVVWSIIRELVKGGTTIFLTTQYLEEADELADKIAVLNGGKIVAEGTPEELKRLVPGGHVKLRLHRADQVQKAVQILAATVSDTDPLGVQVAADGSVESLRKILDTIDREGIEVDELTVHTPDLDDVFLTLTGHTTNIEAAVSA
ncbi:ATP-binding cassette domain-containing protein [Glycomyces algeriensis]|uniref:Daunorubicin resistance protein DrrA family ABC transporter ATP-binding protein n=1 Tax=Glycomyces algeriensis TaxID=256037 RepID=A0A9W6LFQ3_9ACTN|nr:ATP-binding cassette domain-containing protein [Glycomyces algeriensis]MDA1366070.1 ATP-binding cassette domain-containing protein [Glycomyces algeriensis]MDR7349163.1 ABC-2 type transport system ATP-binding protein [Glycomyces algeriensis]GLI41863.1 daunorubicin resistance protein DrrA family ABC transporter ATP-binding protein [Glycomyces algeriensis]